jgi:hypothetical protein
VAAAARCEPRGPLDHLAGRDRLDAEPELVGKRGGKIERPLIERRRAIRSHACWRPPRDLGGEVFGEIQRLAGIAQAVDDAELEGFAGTDGAPGQDEVERASFADQSGKADGTAVDQRDAPATIEHTERRVARRNAQVAPQRELEPACNCVTLDRGDNRLAQAEPRRTHRSVAVLAGHVRALAGRDRLEVRSGAKRPARAPQDPHGGGVVGIELPEGGRERLGGRPVDGVPHLGAVDDDHGHRASLLDSDAVHASL